MANSVVEYFSMAQTKELIDKLVEKGVNVSSFAVSAR